MNIRRQYKGWIAAATLASSALAVGTGGGSASALTSCHAASCHGLNPSTTICTSDARTVATTSVNGRRIELRYSPQCRAAWARITNGNAGDYVVVQRSDGATYRRTITSGTDTFTNMVNDAGFTARARGVDERFGPDAESPWTSWY